MNSEELEQSLRTEFESYLKDTIAEMKQEVSGFQKKIESEFEQHKTRIDGAVKEFTEKIEENSGLEKTFEDSIAEHLKLAREDGSKVTATAFEEAEKLRDNEDSEAEAVFEFTDIRDAINEISSKDSQSEILKSLVHHATQFTPRGAFFIVKNEHLVGWRMFGSEEHPNPQIVREVFFPVTSKTALSESVNTLATVEGCNEEGEDNSVYLDKLDFVNPENMYAIPLVARGRGVAVLYADNGTQGEKVNVEALETLLRVAGLTVEVLASNQIARSKSSEPEAKTELTNQVAPSVATQSVEQDFSSDLDTNSVSDSNQFEDSFDSDNQVNPPSFEQSGFSNDDGFSTDLDSKISNDEQSTGFEFEADDGLETLPTTDENDDTYSFADSVAEPIVEETSQEFSVTESLDDDFSTSIDEEEYSVSFDDGDSNLVGTVENDLADSAESLSFDSSGSDSYQTEETSEFQTSQFDGLSSANNAVAEAPQVADQSEYEFESNESNDFNQAVEAPIEKPVQETISEPPARTRFGNRNVDLPIEVAEDERRLHNDARRFARLLVSEIKLYNEQKVKEGRESSDLYERLREAIDRSREMYDKRVQPPVAAKFDYFNYELINTLAEGEEGKLGGSYPGATV